MSKTDLKPGRSFPSIRLASLLSILLSIVLLGCGARRGDEAHGRKVHHWVDPMHPFYTSDRPGKAPDCGMDLVPVYEEPTAPISKPGSKSGSESKPVPESGSAAVELSADEVRAAGVATERVASAPLVRTIRAVGTLEIDETRIVHLAARVAGRIDRLDLDSTGKTVRRGDPVYSLYSPDLVAAGREVALARDNLSRARGGGDARDLAAAEALVAAARERLALWGIERDAIERLANGETADLALTVRSPIRGTVLERKVARGEYVTAGQDLFVLADLGTLWLSAQVQEQDLDGIRIGQEAVARFAAFPGRERRGRVEFLSPIVDPLTRTVGVRITMPNRDGALKPGLFANVELRVDLGRGLAIAKSAVLDTGARQRVYVEIAPGRYVGRDVRVGAATEDRVQILAGLQEGEAVVTAANFLIDSQALLAPGQAISWSGATVVPEAKATEKPQ